MGNGATKDELEGSEIMSEGESDGDATKARKRRTRSLKSSFRNSATIVNSYPVSEQQTAAISSEMKLKGRKPTEKEEKRRKSSSMNEIPMVNKDQIDEKKFESGSELSESLNLERGLLKAELQQQSKKSKKKEKRSDSHVEVFINTGMDTATESEADRRSSLETDIREPEQLSEAKEKKFKWKLKREKLVSKQKDDKSESDEEAVTKKKNKESQKDKKEKKTKKDAVSENDEESEEENGSAKKKKEKKKIGPGLLLRIRKRGKYDLGHTDEADGGRELLQTNQRDDKTREDENETPCRELKEEEHDSGLSELGADEEKKSRDAEKKKHQNKKSHLSDSDNSDVQGDTSTISTKKKDKKEKNKKKKSKDDSDEDVDVKEKRKEEDKNKHQDMSGSESDDDKKSRKKDKKHKKKKDKKKDKKEDEAEDVVKGQKKEKKTKIVKEKKPVKERKGSVQVLAPHDTEEGGRVNDAHVWDQDSSASDEDLESVLVLRDRKTTGLTNKYRLSISNKVDVRPSQNIASNQLFTRVNSPGIPAKTPTQLFISIVPGMIESDGDDK